MHVGAGAGGMVGLVAGGAVGGVVGAVAGTLTPSPTGSTASGAGHGARTLGSVVGCMGAAVVGLPSAVVGGVLGGAVGTAEDVANGAQALGAKASLQHRRTVQSRKAKMLRVESNSEARAAIGMPKEALPMLTAIVVAQRRGVLTQEEGLNRATAFAVTVADGGLSLDEVTLSAEVEARRLLTWTLLAGWYPNAASRETQGSADRLVESITPERASVLDGLWHACGPELDADFRALLPPHPRTLSQEHLADVLKQATDDELPQFLLRLAHHFPGRPTQEYKSRMEGLRSSLNPSEFWSVYRLLQHASLPEEFQGAELELLADPEVIASLRTFLSSSAWLVAAGEGGQQMTDLTSSAQFGSVSFDATGPFARPHEAVEGKQLQVEVLYAESLGHPEYRFGDFLSRRSSWNLNAYAEVEVAGVRQQTRPVAVKRGARADIGERVLFSLPENGGSETATWLTVKVFDARGLQSAVRGDPQIGQVKLRVPLASVAEPCVQQLTLMKDGKAQGSVALRCGVLAPETAYTVLAKSAQHSFVECAIAFSQVLAQLHGVDMLLAARPAELVAVSAVREDQLRAMLRRWVQRLCSQAMGLSRESPEAAWKHGRRLGRGALEVVAACAQDASGDEVVEMAVRWLRGIISGCAGEEAAAAVNEQMLRKLLDDGDSQHGGRTCLADFRVALPGTLSAAGVSDAVLERLREAEANEEDEMFTGERIVSDDGGVMPGLAAVKRQARNGNQWHIFLYDHKSIKQWQRERGEDPITREALHKQEIILLQRL